MSQEHLQSRRREILAAAEKVFDACGYAATTMDAVAGEAGIAKGSIYNYFRSKRELFAAVFSEAMAVHEAHVGKIISGPMSASQKIEAVLESWLDRLNYHMKIGRLVLESWATASRQEQQGMLSDSLRQGYTRWHQLMVGIIGDGIAAGEFNPSIFPQVAASMFLAVLNGLELHAILGMGVNIDRAFLDKMKQSLLEGMAANTSGPIALAIGNIEPLKSAEMEKD